MVTLEAVQSDITVLKQALNSWREDKSTSAGDRFQVCEQANQWFYERCFQCGSNDHNGRAC